ncbi:DUF4442 domain-containing protein [bacterium]|nr:DUF4442 domain-containing protein [bacterium]
MASKPRSLATWEALQSKPGGSWLFSKFICRTAPYFASIKPHIRELAAGRCLVTAPKRRAVTNHIGTFHAIAMCNMAEIAGGMAADASVPLTHRWIPKGMTVEYLAKAETDLTATCDFDLPNIWPDKMDLITPVSVTDKHGTEVFRARINMYVTAKPTKAA